MVVHDVVLDLGGHLAMYMLGLMLLDVDGGQGLRSAEDPIVDAREDITLQRIEEWRSGWSVGRISYGAGLRFEIWICWGTRYGLWVTGDYGMLGYTYIIRRQETIGNIEIKSPKSNSQFSIKQRQSFDGRYTLAYL